MFSISSTEFPQLNTFVDKIKALHSNATNNDGNHEDTGAHELREWCAEHGYILHFSKTKSSGTFYTLKYDRAKLTEEQYATVGHFRSVTFDNQGRICCVAPVKMLKITDDVRKEHVNSLAGHLIAEEFVEGVMVNLFWREGEGDRVGKWYIATKSCVSEVSFDHIIEAQAQAQASSENAPDTTTTTFQKLSVQEVLRRRICDVLSLLPGGLEIIPKEYCYSLVIQHPKNQIVNTITVPRLYIIAVYQLSALDKGVGVNVIRVNRDIFSANFGGSVSRMPVGLSCVEDSENVEAIATFTPHTVEDYCRMYASADTRSISLPGVVFVDADTGFCYKARNPKYESIKKRKGIEQKLMAQYLQMRKDHGIDEYLKEHPQHARIFRQFRDRFHDYTQRLYEGYIAHYVKKDPKALKDYDRELKTHMYKLHYDIYLATMKDTGSFVSKHTVINYVNNLAVAQQLACLNATSDFATASATASGSASGSATARANILEPTSDHTQRKSFSTRQIKSIERSQVGRGSETGFRSARNARGGRILSVSSLSIPPVGEANMPTDIKGSKMSGSVKVHNKFAGLDADAGAELTNQ